MQSACALQAFCRECCTMCAEVVHVLATATAVIIRAQGSGTGHGLLRVCMIRVLMLVSRDLSRLLVKLSGSIRTGAGTCPAHERCGRCGGLACRCTAGTRTRFESEGV